jgi:crotonobetainyl-CoA:carnitine CoA-transferase CaiB-like acyl-CoA transferase
MTDEALSSKRPLEGIRVFDLTLLVLGPWTAMLLATLGAEVFKVEAPRGDPSRANRPTQQGLSITYLHGNLGKKAIELDLKQKRDKEIALKLASTCDVFIENMRPGTVERLGLGYEAIRELNPEVIYLSANAYGRHGPMQTQAGVDLHMQAFSGWSSITGREGGSWESFRLYAHLDVSSACYAVDAILMALYAREIGRGGQRIDLTMLGSAMALQTSRFAEYFATGVSPVPLGSANATTVPHQAFLCQEGRYVAVGVEQPEQWHGLCRALDRPEWRDDPRFSTNAGRVAHREVLVPLLEEIFCTRPVDWWVLLLARHGVPAAPFVAMDFDRLRYHPQTRANAQIVSVPSALGEIVAGGPPWQFKDAPLAYGPPPTPGQHTDEVVTALGFPPFGNSADTPAELEDSTPRAEE